MLSPLVKGGLQGHEFADNRCTTRVGNRRQRWYCPENTQRNICKKDTTTDRQDKVDDEDAHAVTLDDLNYTCSSRGRGPGDGWPTEARCSAITMGGRPLPPATSTKVLPSSCCTAETSSLAAMHMKPR